MNKAVPEPINRLIEAFARLPGVGPKTASRLTYYLLRAPDAVSQELAEALSEVKSKTRFCSVCHTITMEDPCNICSDPERDQSVIAVVEEPLDVLALERTASFDGVYHVLHGVIDPVNGVGPDDLRIRELVERARSDDVNEVIVATNPGYEGDATAAFIKGELVPLGLKVTRLARGVPIGGDIEYVDAVTLMRALQGRSEL